jgi:superfamily II DNA/RNA helicase
MLFKELISDERILKTLEGLGYEKATPIQVEAIPQILKGGDLRAASQTGTGKTAAFLLPTLIKLSQSKDRKGPKVVALVPTRELAIQLATEAAKLGRSLNLVTVTLYGGVPYPKQIRDLSRPHDILIATPGRLMDLMDKRKVNLKNIEIFILDEADRMLDMGFIGPVEDIAAQLPQNKQTLMFTATFGKNIRRLSEKLLKNPFEISTDHTENKLANIEQHFLRADSLSEKHRCLEKILAESKIHQAIIFSSTKRQTRQIAEDLREMGLAVGSLHGDLNQRQRTKTLGQFREGKIKFLVATDVAGRGIDVLTISHVINFDVPNSLDDYIHRIGRTGRAGNKGVAFSFFSSKDREIRREIEQFSGIKVPGEDRPGAFPKKPQGGYRGGFRGGNSRDSRGPRKFQNKGFGGSKKRSFPDRNSNSDRGFSKRGPV